MKKYAVLFSVVATIIAILMVNYYAINDSSQEIPTGSKLVPSAIDKNPPRKELSKHAQPSKPTKPVAARAPSRQQSETQAFLELIASAQNREEVFSTPSKHVLAGNIDGHWVAQGDLLISENQLVEETENFELRLAIIKKINFWPNNTVPFYIDPSLDKFPILEAISILHNHTNLRFIDQIDEADYIYFKPTNQETCLSYLGRKGGEQEILINQRYCGMGNILHEIMHALGFVHEHSREDRDNFVNIHWDAIRPEKQGQFQKLSADISLPFSFRPDFDFDSVMLYSSRAFAIGSAPSMTKKDASLFEANRKNLSVGDVEKINAIYTLESLPEF